LADDQIKMKEEIARLQQENEGRKKTNININKHE